MPLVKAKIIPNGDESKAIIALFNPQEYTVNYRNSFRPDKTKKGQLFIRQERPTLSMRLFLDTTETGKSVRDYVDQILNLMEPVDSQAVISTFVWGKFTFKGVLTTAKQNYIMFLGTGIPVRATVDVTFIDYGDWQKNS